jgi:protein-S-isoprenylcysteine O-methyltransferase Ste14
MNSVVAAEGAQPVASIEGKRRLSDVQRRRKWRLRVAIAITALILPFVRSRWPAESLLHEVLEETGLVLIATCIFGRAWCILYIGGRKTDQLVDLGPYSVSRNPLYVFSFLGAFGIGLQSGSMTIGLICLALAAAVFVPVVLREEAVLKERFGPVFAAYRARVPRFWPRISAWRDARRMWFSPVLLYSTLRDSLVFALAYPLFELLELAQDQGVLPVLARLP